MIAVINKSGVKYDYLYFFQGSDLPIKTQDEIHDFFDNNSGYEFVSIEKARRSMAENKARYRHFFCHNRFFRKNRLVKALNFGLVYFQKLLNIQKNTDIRLYQGSALFSITGECACYLETQISSIYKRFRYALAEDEVFMQSILMASPYRDYIKDIDKEVTCNARMIDRIRLHGKNSPHIWRADEFDFLRSLPQEYCLARKFDEKVDMEIVEKIYRSMKVENNE